MQQVWAKLHTCNINKMLIICDSSRPPLCPWLYLKSFFSHSCAHNSSNKIFSRDHILQKWIYRLFFTASITDTLKPSLSPSCIIRPCWQTAQKKQHLLRGCCRGQQAGCGVVKMSINTSECWINGCGPQVLDRDTDINETETPMSPALHRCRHN